MREVEPDEASLGALLREHGVPGVAVGRRRDGEWSFQAAGLRDVERALPVEIDTPFEIGSLAKPLFACAVLQLVREGSLDLDVPIDAYLKSPLLPQQDGACEITARHLLTHTSGLPNWRPGRFTHEPGPLELGSAPGERWSYSGEGFQLLQTLALHISGGSLEAFMRERLLEPLEMHASTYTWLSAYAGRAARGYTADGAVVPVFDPRQAEGMAAASLKSTISDVAKLVDTLLGDHAQERLRLHASPRELFFAPQVDVGPKLGWALGWAVEVRDVGNVAWHWCSTRSSFWSFLAICAETGEAAIVFTNAPGGRAVCEQLVRRTIAGDHPAFYAGPLGPGA